MRVAEGLFGSGKFAALQPDDPKLGQRPAELPPQVRPQLLARMRRLARRRPEVAAETEDLGAVHPAPAVDAAQRVVATTPPLHRLGEFLSPIMLAKSLPGADQLTVDEADRQGIHLIYETFSVPALFAPLAELLVEAARPRPGDRLVDVACGTGIVLRTAASHVGPQGRLAGVDVNPDMVAVAREIAEQEGLTAELLEAPADALPLPDASADLVLCGAGLMFFTDRVAALSEMRRVVVPDGRIAISVLQDISRHPFYEGLFGAIQTHLGVADFVTPFVLGDETELRELFQAAGLVAADVEQCSFTARFPQPERFLPAAVNTAAAGGP